MAEAISLLDPYATSYEFRYLKVGARTLPVLDAVRRAAEDLFNAVRPTCHATVGGAIPDRG